MKIEMGKEYETRDGRPVRILCTDAEGDHTVVGLVKYRTEPYMWNLNGNFSTLQPDHYLDLVEKPVPIVLYCDLYPDDIGAGWRTKERAIEYGNKTYIGILKITILGKDVQTEFIPR